MSTSAKPWDYNVHAMNKTTDAKAQVGRGYKNADGSIAVILNAFVVIPGGRDMLITLFPYDGKFDTKQGKNHDDVPS